MDENFVLEDFTQNKENLWSGFNVYVLNKDYFIFNKPVLHTDYISYKLVICLNKNKILPEYIFQINNYLKLLNSNIWENKLINYFCSFYNEETCVSKDDYININKMIDDKWFENLEVWSARITIDKNEKISSNFVCKEDYGLHYDVLRFNVNENDLFGMEYEYMGDAYS